jgi:hypothetical protein
MTKRLSLITINFLTADPEPPSTIESREGEAESPKPDETETNLSSMEHELRIDEQTENFLELKQKLTHYSKRCRRRLPHLLRRG